MPECELCAARKRIAELELKQDQAAPEFSPGDLVIFTKDRAIDSPRVGAIGVVLKHEPTGNYHYMVAIPDCERPEGYCFRNTDFPGKLIRWVRPCEIAPANH